MKILIIFDLNLGLQMAHDTFLMKMCHSLVSLGHKVFFLVGSGDNIKNIWEYYGLPPNNNLEIIKIPRIHRKRVPLINLKISLTKVFNFFCKYRIKRIYLKEGIDIVYLSGLKPAELFLKIQKKLPIPYVYEMHQIFSEDYPHLNLFQKEYKILKNSSGIITTTAALKEKLLSIYNLQKDKIHVVHLATDTFKHNSSDSLDGKSKNLCYFGQLYPLQGIEIAIESLLYLSNEVKLHVFGGNPKRIDELTSFAERKGVVNRVIFHGFVPPSELREKVNKLTPILIMPSLSGGRMNYVAHSKIYEYLSYGLPIVASDLSSIKEVFSDSKAAVLVKPDSARDLSEGIQWLLQNPDEAQKLSLQAIKLAQKYSWLERAKTLLDIFNSATMAPLPQLITRQAKGRIRKP